jgi:homoserine kinase
MIGTGGPSRRVELRVPASTSNLGPGFDAIGLAVGLYNEFVFERLETGLDVVLEGEGANVLERGTNNRTYRAFSSVYETLGRPTPGVRIIQRTSVPLARGLGGSATAVLAGTTAAFLFADVKADRSRVLDQSFTIETHPDNITPSLVGGLTVSIVDGSHVAYVKVVPPPELTTVTLIPDRPLETADARRVVPTKISREDAVFNIRGAGMIMGALATEKLDHLAAAMRDRLHQPYRAPLLPGMEEIFEAALDAGSPGVALSGAGSGIFAFAFEGNVQAIGQAMTSAAARHGMESYALPLPIENDGLQITCVS